MQNFASKLIWHALVDFYLFSRWRLLLLLALMFAQSSTAGIGLLFIVPLLELVGLDIGAGPDNGIVNFAEQVFSILGISPSLHSVLISYVVIIICIATLRFILTLMSSSIRHAYLCRLRCNLYRQLLYSYWEFILSRRMPDFLHSLTIQIQMIGQVVHLLLSIISQFILSGIFIGLAFLLSWKISLLTLFFSGLLIMLLFPLNKVIYSAGRKELISYKSMIQQVTEQLTSLKMIKSFAAESHYANRLQSTSEALKKQYVEFSRIQAATHWIYMVGSVVGFSVFFYVAQTYLEVPVETTLLLLIIFSRIFPQVLAIHKNIQQLQHKIPTINDIHSMQAACLQHREMIENYKYKPLQLKHCITIDNIAYAYPQGSTPIFQHFSVSIECYQTVAVVGPSGAGKSTLADLIAGLLAPQSGTIYCDGIPLIGERRIAWRKSVAYVTQNIFFFNDTIRSNLCWVAENVDERALWEALRLAAAEEFVSKLPQGLDTAIGDQGLRLSGGERQRLALARALLTKPSLLILDEATSALDCGNELLIQQMLKQLHRQLTIVIISHRESSICHVDKKIVLPENTIEKCSYKDVCTTIPKAFEI